MSNNNGLIYNKMLAICLMNNVYLTTVLLSLSIYIVVIMQNTPEKVDLWETKVNATKQETFVWMEITLYWQKMEAQETK